MFVMYFVTYILCTPRNRISHLAFFWQKDVILFFKGKHTKFIFVITYIPFILFYPTLIVRLFFFLGFLKSSFSFCYFLFSRSYSTFNTFSFPINFLRNSINHKFRYFSWGKSLKNFINLFAFFSFKRYTSKSPHLVSQL